MKNSDEKLRSGSEKNKTCLRNFGGDNILLKTPLSFTGMEWHPQRLRSKTICWSPPRVKITVKELGVEISWEIHPVFHGNPRFLHVQRL